MQFSIFRKWDNIIVHTLQCENYSEFRKYWLAQPAPEDYGWREINPVPKTPFKFQVIETPDGHHVPTFNGEYTRHDLTDELCEKIAKSNTYLTAAEVHHCLLKGQTIYTSFRAYTLE